MNSPNRPDGAITDLERVLGYRDVAAAPGVLRHVGQGMVVVPWWNAAFCTALIRAAEAVGVFAADPDDPVPGQEISLAAISPRLFEAVQDDVGRRLWPQLRTVWPYIDYFGLRDAFVITYAVGGQEELRIHHDVAQVSVSIKLNDDYDGAALEFPLQGASNSEAGIGEALCWPGLVTHPHRSAPITRGVKYSLTMWCELPSF